jgi:hypothetical protein
MTGYGNTSRTRKTPRSRGRMRSGSGPDRATLGIIGLVCAIAGFFVLGIILGPVAVVAGWLSMGRRWASSNIPAVVAVALGAIDILLALVWLVGQGSPGNGLF